MTKKKDESNPVKGPEKPPEGEPGPGPTETAAVAIDNPAQTILEGADEGREQIEPVEEVIEEHTPATIPPQRGIDELFQKFDDLEKKVTQFLTPAKPEPEVKPDEPTQPTTPTQEGTPTQEPTTDKPKRTRIKLFR